MEIDSIENFYIGLMMFVRKPKCSWRRI